MSRDRREHSGAGSAHWGGGSGHDRGCVLSAVRHTPSGSFGGSVVKNSPTNAGDARDSGLVSGLGRSPGGGHGIPLQYSCLRSPMDRRACWATAHGVAKGQTRLKRLSMHARDLHPRVASMSSQAMWNCFQGFLAVSGSVLGLVIRGFWTGC